MSVAICRSSTASLPLEKEGFGSILTTTTSPANWLAAPVAEKHNSNMISKEEEEMPPGQLDIWSSIQEQKKSTSDAAVTAPYVHPLVRKSSGLLSQKSLEVCTESLGSETGSDDRFSSDDDDQMSGFFSLFASNRRRAEQQVQQQQEHHQEHKETIIAEEEETVEAGEKAVKNARKEAVTVNYHCSISRRSPPRSFPPPLPSLSRRDGPCLQMRPHRRDGRLVVEAVTVPSQNYLHANRQGGRLLLSFIDVTSPRYENNENESNNSDAPQDQLQEEGEEIEEIEEDEEEILEEEEEEVEVVDRGTIVEVKVSTQPQQQSGAGSMKVHRSSLVINKFVSCMPIDQGQQEEHEKNKNCSDLASAEAAPPPSPQLPPLRRIPSTTAAAAAVAASSVSTLPSDGHHSSSDNKLLFSSKRRNREDLLHDMRRCSELRKPLFIWEPWCIATST